MTREMPDHDYSLGWNRTPRNSPWVRTGSLVGTSALVLRYPDGECRVFITNTSTWKGHAFSHDTMALFERPHGSTAPPSRVAICLNQENNVRKRTANVVWFSFFYYICHHIYNI